MANDLPQFCDGLATIIHDVLSAILDGAFFTVRLAQLTTPGWSAVSWMYVTTAVVAVRSMSPPFGKMQSVRNSLHELFRQALSKTEKKEAGVTQTQQPR